MAAAFEASDVSKKRIEESTDAALAQQQEDELSLQDVWNKFFNLTPATLNKIVSGSVFVLVLVGLGFLHRDWGSDLAYLHVGFLCVCVALFATVQFVLAESAKIKAEEVARQARQEAGEDAAEDEGEGVEAKKDK